MLTVKQTREDVWLAVYTAPEGMWNVCIEAPDEATANKWIKAEIQEEAKLGIARHKKYLDSYKAAQRLAKPWWRFW